MARSTAVLPAGQRITDYISLGVIAKYFPRHVIDDVLRQTKRESVRERDLPAHVVVYYVIALSLYMQSSYREVLRCLLEGLRWLADPSLAPRVAGKSGISQARSRLGAGPVRTLYDTVARPVAGEKTRNAVPWMPRLHRSRRQHTRCRRYERQRRNVWPPEQPSRRLRLSEDPFRDTAGMRHARALQRTDERLQDVRDGAGCRGCAGAGQRRAVPGGSLVFELLAVERREKQWCGFAVAYFAEACI